MNIDQWVLQILRAYQLLGFPFSAKKKSSLLAELSDESTETQKDIIAEALDVMTHYFFKKAASGETFGPLSRIKEEFGQSLEENYGLSSGPFINMAKTYWTYKLEVRDLFPEHNNIALAQMLLSLETNIAGLFFPTPGPMTISVNKRREAQRQVLQEYAPEIDIDIFLGNNPILGTSLQDSRSFMRAYKGRPVLSGLVSGLWLSVIINSIRAVYYLINGRLGDAGLSFIWGIGSFVLWYAIHNWALRHPKD
jgi:hypothetical protein